MWFTWVEERVVLVPGKVVRSLFKTSTSSFWISSTTRKSHQTYHLQPTSMWNRILHPGKKKNEKVEREPIIEPTQDQLAPIVTNRPRSYTARPAPNSIPSTSPPQYVVETRSESPPPILGAPITDIIWSTSPPRARSHASSPPPSRNTLPTAHSYTRSPPQPTQTYPFIPHHRSPERSPPTTLEQPQISLPPPPRRRTSRNNLDGTAKRGIRRVKSSQSVSIAHDGPRPPGWHAFSGQASVLRNAAMMPNGSGGSLPERRPSSRGNETGSGKSGSEEAGKDVLSHSTSAPPLSRRRKNPPEGWI